MDIEDIKKQVQSFEEKLKPITAEEKAMAAGAEPGGEIPAVVEEPVPAGVVAEGAACVTKDFKAVVGALQSGYVGKGDVPQLVQEFLESLPECQE